MTQAAVLPLAGLRVLEHGEHVAAAFTARLLCDLGAEVTKIEPPGGDRARRYGYVPEGADASCLFAYTNAGKQSVLVDTDTPEGRARLQELIATTDVLIDSHTAQWWREATIDFDALAGTGRCRLAVSITPFGRSGPRAEWAADHLSLFHAGGEAFALPGGIGWERYPEREPIKAPGHVGELDAGMSGAVAILAWLLSARQPAVIELSIQEALLLLSRVDLSRWPMEGWYETRASRSFPVLGLVQCSDGWVQVMTIEQTHWEKLVEAIGSPAWAHELGATPVDRLANSNELNALLSVWFEERTKQTVHETLQAHGVPVGIVRTPQEVLESVHLRTRQFFGQLQWPGNDETRVPLHAYSIRRADGAEWRPGPSSGVPPLARADDRPLHRQSVDGDVAATPAGTGRDLWLSGLRVLELTRVIAGPWAGSLMAAFGAESIKIENALRPDSYRRSKLSAPDDPSTIDLNYRFNEVNPGKRSIHLDLGSERGRELFKQLIAESDVLIQSFRPGYLEQYGMSAIELLTWNPRLVLVSLSAHGAPGPEANRPGYAAIFAAEGGLSALTGYSEEVPTEYRGAIDMRVGTTTTFATLVGLLIREQSGEGAHVDVSATEVPAVLIGEQLIESQIRGATGEPMGNHDPVYAPHNCYPSLDGDTQGWATLAVETDEQWQRLVREVGDPALEAGWGERERKTHEQLIDDRIAAWSREQHRDSLVPRLQALGIPSAPTMHARDVFEDEHLQMRGIWTTVQHGRMGEVSVLGLPWLINGSRLPMRAAPLLGVDTSQVLGNLSGVSPEEIQAMTDVLPPHSRQASVPTSNG